MESSVKEFMNQVEERGSVYQGSISSLEDLDDIIFRLKRWWKDEEVLILCGGYTTSEFRKLLKTATPEDTVTYELGVPTFSNLMCEGSFFRGGLTFHVIEKPKMGRDSLWVSVNRNATAMESLIVKM